MESRAAGGCADSFHAGNVQRAAKQTDRKATKKETATAAAVQQGPDAESMEDIFTLRQRLAIMAGGTIAVVVTGYSLWRYRQISAELIQVKAEADLLQKRLSKLSSERDENVGQLASKSGENARLKTDNAQLESAEQPAGAKLRFKTPELAATERFARRG